MSSNNINYEVFSIESRKGGVGKTTMALNLAKALIAKGYKVLYLDCDISGTPVSVATEHSMYWNQYANAMHEEDGGPSKINGASPLFTMHPALNSAPFRNSTSEFPEIFTTNLLWSASLDPSSTISLVPCPSKTMRALPVSGVAEIVIFEQTSVVPFVKIAKCSPP